MLCQPLPTELIHYIRSIPCLLHISSFSSKRMGERASYKGLRLLLNVLSRHHALKEATDPISFKTFNTFDSLTTAHNSSLRKVSGKYNKFKLLKK